MLKIHKIENLDTLESELNKIISELEIDNDILNISFKKILGYDVTVILFESNITREDKRNERIEHVYKLRNEQLENNTKPVEKLDIPITELADEFLQKNKMDYNILRASHRFSLDIKIREWLKSKKGIDESSLHYRDLSWHMRALITSKIELELRQNIPKMKDDLYNWCLENNVKKITKSFMKGYFEEKDEWCPSSITDILYTKVNVELSKNKL